MKIQVWSMATLALSSMYALQGCGTKKVHASASNTTKSQTYSESEPTSGNDTYKEEKSTESQSENARPPKNITGAFLHCNPYKDSIDKVYSYYTNCKIENPDKTYEYLGTSANIEAPEHRSYRAKVQYSALKGYHFRVDLTNMADGFDKNFAKAIVFHLAFPHNGERIAKSFKSPEVFATSTIYQPVVSETNNEKLPTEDTLRESFDLSVLGGTYQFLKLSQNSIICLATEALFKSTNLWSCSTFTKGVKWKTVARNGRSYMINDRFPGHCLNSYSLTLTDDSMQCGDWVVEGTQIRNRDTNKCVKYDLGAMRSGYRPFFEVCGSSETADASSDFILAP